MEDWIDKLWNLEDWNDKTKILMSEIDANPNRHALRPNKQYWNMMRTSIDTLWDPTKILEYLPKKAKIQIFDRTLTQRL